MLPATIELLTIAAVIALIVAYSARATRPRRRDERKLAQGRPNEEHTNDLAASGVGQSGSPAMVEAAAGTRRIAKETDNRETERAAFSGYSG